MDYRKCNTCYDIKTLDQFQRLNVYKCKKCVSEYNKIREREYKVKREMNIRVIPYTQYKACTKCLANKPIKNFRYRLKRDYYIYNSQCKECELLYKHKYYNERKDDSYFKLHNSLRRGLHHSLRNYSKSETLEKYIGCSLQFFYKWIEYQFDANMNWSNEGHYWHIDHTFTISKFDFINEQNIYNCWNWANLRPLEARENLIKSNKIDMVLYNNQLIKAEYFKMTTTTTTNL